MLRVNPELAGSAETALRNLTGLEEYPRERIGFDEWGRALSDLKQKRESFHLRLAAAGALWQQNEGLRPALATLIADLLRDWDYFSSMKGPIPEEKAVVPALVAMASDSSYAKVHAAAKEALGRICGVGGERW